MRAPVEKVAPHHQRNRILQQLPSKYTYEYAIPPGKVWNIVDAGHQPAFRRRAEVKPVHHRVASKVRASDFGGGWEGGRRRAARSCVVREEPATIADIGRVDGGEEGVCR